MDMIPEKKKKKERKGEPGEGELEPGEGGNVPF